MKKAFLVAAGLMLIALPALSRARRTRTTAVDPMIDGIVTISKSSFAEWATRGRKPPPSRRWIPAAQRRYNGGRPV